MKKQFFAFGFLISAQLVFAQVPRITNKKFSNYQKFTVNEKAEVGTFFLLQSLAAKGVIGGNSGVCVNYKRGDSSGNEDQITFAVKSDASASGYVEKSKESQAEIEKIKPVLSQMQKFFSRNCKGVKTQNECVDISVTGYSDGTRAAGANDPSVSMKKNTDLAKARADLYGTEIESTGITKYGKITPSGSPSKFGNYLDIINKVHNGNINAFLGSLKKNGSEYNFTLLHKERFQNILSGKEKYKIDCPARRVTTLDFKFNPSSVQFAENTQTTVSPSLYGGGSEFNFNVLIDVGLQVGVVTNGESLQNSTDAEVDKVIEKTMKNSGITDQDMLSQCKGNPGARQMVRFLSKQINKLSEAKRTQVLSEARIDRSVVIVKMRNQETSSALKTFYDDLADEVDNTKKRSDFPGQFDGGLSNTKLNCFGLKSTLKAYAQSNGDKIKKACISTDSNSKIKVRFNAKPTFIGCTQCSTGLRVEEVSYKDPVTGNQMKKFEPVYKPREKNTQYGDHIGYSKGSYFSPMNKLDGEILSLQKIRLLAKVPNNIAIGDQDFLTKFNAEIASIEKNGSFTHLKFLAVGNFSKYAVLLKKYYGLEPSDLPAITNYVTRVSRESNSSPEEAAAQAYVRAGLDKKDMAAAQRIYIAASRTNANDPMETARHSSDPASQFTLGGLKGPSYYELDNCDCSDPGLIDRVIANGKRHNITDESEIKNKAGGCIVSLPVPTSCMVSPNNPGGDVHSDKHIDSEISWIDSEGNEINGLLDNLANEVANSNTNFDFQGCKENSPFSLAQQVVNSVKCDPSQGFIIPTDEFKDCGGE